MAEMETTGRIRIGISGWTYPPWRGGFYPKGLRQKDELSYAARQFSSIEINGTFYGLQKPDSFMRWRDETPEGFVFAVKAPRYITHDLKLRDVETPLANFIASGVLSLGAKLGPILWQFPPAMRFDAALFRAFLEMLPHSPDEAEALACRHDDHVEGRTVLTASEGMPRLRHAVEIRNESFRTPDFIALLRDHDVALVCADSVEWPLLTDLTSDFVYCRLHGSQELYISGYDDKALDQWAGRVRIWARGGEAEETNRIAAPMTTAAGRDVFVYFDNTYKKLRAPVDAAALADRLGLKD